MKTLDERLKLRPYMKNSQVLAWGPEENLKVGSILVTQGQEILDSYLYLELLADRVELMIKQDSQPKRAEAYLREEFFRAGLIGDQTLPVRDLMQSPELWSRLRALGVFPRKRVVVQRENKQARAAIEETSLEEWVQAVV